MKKFNFFKRVLWIVVSLLTLLTVSTTNAWGTDFTLSSASSVTQDGITVSFAKGDGGTAPTWYAAGLRLYASNTVTISSSVNITSITFNWEKQGSKAFASASASTGTYSHPVAAGEGTWTGSATSITFTLGSSGQLQLNTLSVIAGAAAGPSITVGSLSPSGNFDCNLSTGVPNKKSFTVSGSNLKAAISITPPSGYEISTSENGTYQTTAISLAKNGSNAVASTTIWVRLQSSNAAGSYSGNISCTSTDATTRTVAVSGSNPFTVTWSTPDDANYATTYVAYATAPGTALGTLPSNPSTSCGGRTFYGWYDGVSYSHASVAPSIISTSTTITSDKTFIAVFATRSGSGAVTWDKVTSAPSDWSGDYVIVESSGANAMISDFVTGTSGEFKSASVTINAAGTQITSTPTDKMIWTFAKNGNNAQYSLKNKSTSTYAKITGTSSTNAALDANAQWFTIESTGTSGVWDVASVSNSARCFAWYSSNSSFRTYAKSSYNTGRLFKKSGDGYTYSNYVTTCGTCSSNPTVGVAALKGTFNASGVGVTCPTTGTDVQTNCSWTDYGFVWSTTNSTTSNLVLNADGTAPSGNNKVQIGTSGNANTFDGTITPVLPATALSAGTYYYRAYGKNGYASGTYQYSSSVSSFVARSVTFNLHDHGSAIATQLVKDGTKATAPSAPTADGWRFDGWWDNSSYTGSAWDFSSNTVSSNITLHAKWTRVYTVTYAYGTGGSGSCANGSYAAGETVTTCSSATKTASTLTSWLRSDNSATITPGNTFTMPSTNVTLTAVWEDTPYTLTQTVGANTTKGYTASTIKSGDTPLDLTYSISAANKALPKTVTISGGRASWTLGTDYTWTLSSDKHSATLHINATIISSNMTVTVTEQTRYTVVWDRPGDGNDETEYYAADDNSVTMKTGEADCGIKKFYCWTETPGSLSPTPTAATSGTISGNKTYTAVYGDRSGGEGFEKVTAVQDGATYYIATGLTSSDYGCGGQNGSNSYADAVSLSTATFNGSSVLTAFPSGVKAITVAVSGNYFSMYDGTKYLTLTSNSNALDYANSAAYVWELTASDYYIKPKDYSRWIMRNSARFACYSNAQDKSYAYLYKPAVSWSNFSTSCELYDININTPSGGTVTTSPASETGAGQTVTVNVTPNSCKYLSALKYNDGSDHAINIASTPYTFTMPASDVTVTATFSDKTVSSIAPNTSEHRYLMLGSAFVGEQIRVTYNNGETEDLAWDNAALTFTGYNMSTLGNQTVTVSYSDCGSTSTTYSIEITDGIPITFSDCGITSTTKYQPGDAVPVETTSGAYACSGWEFAGWSATAVANNSTSFTPVRNFNASTARTLYAVYAHLGSTFTSAKLTNELREGARYILAYYVNNNDASYGLTGLLPTAKNTNYLQGTHTGNSGIAFNETTVGGLYQYTLTSYTPVSGVLWQLQADGTGYWQLYNIYQKKYLNLSNYSDGYVSVSTSPVGKLVLEDEDENPIYCNGSRVYVKYNDGTKRLAWNRNSGDGYWNQHTSGYQFFLTKDEYFSSTPPCAPRSVTFHGNGGIVTNYEETESDYDLVVTEASRDAGITTPTADMDASDCAGNDWTFMGWLDEEVDVSRVPILTTDLLNDGGGGKSHTITADEEEYWAVYSNTGPAETKYGTISFTKADFNSSYSSTENTTTKTVTSMGDYVFGYKNIGHSSEIGIQFQEDNGELYNKTSLGKVNSISFTTFSAGGINKLNVYVGDEEKTTDHLLTAEEMQNVGSTWTYYPTENESYVYITNVGKGNGSYVCVGGISIDFGRGTTIYATTPVCSTIRLSGDVYVTSRNGVGIMAVTPLSVEAHQLAANADVVITSNSSDVYFSTDRTPNFSKASKPTASVTVHADASGELDATPIYVHYKPSTDGTGAPADVTVYANLSPEDPNTKGEKAIHVRNLPNKVVIAAKVGGAYYALPANLNGATNPAAVLIDVDESNMTAIGPASCAYTIWPVKTTSGSGDRYALQGGNAYGERVRFSATNNSNKGLWANNASSDPKTRIDNDAAITAIGSDPAAAYEWKITTTVTDGKWSHTLQTDQSNNTKYLRYWTAASGGPKWGTYASGEQNIYLLPVTEVVQTEAYFVEWGQHGGVVEVDASGVSAAKVKAKLNGVESALQALSQTLTSVKERASVYNYTVNFGNDIDFSAAASAGAALTLKWYNSSDVLVATSNIIVPRIIAESATMSSIESRKTYWTTENGPTNEVHVLPGVTLTADAGSFANSDVTIKQLEIYQGATVKVTTGTLDVDTLVLRNGWSRASSKRYDVARLYIATTANLTTEANHTYADWYIDYDQYYPIAVPWDVTLANIRYRYCSVSPTIGDNQNIRLRYYDGASRASGGSGTNWKDYGKSGNTDMPTKIVPSQGYAITAKRPAGKAFSILRMPLTIPANTWTALGEQGEVIVSSVTTHKNQVSVEAYGDDKTPWYAKGWNFIANPYMSVFNGNDNGVTGKLMNQQGTSIKYATIPDTDFKDYYQVNMAEANLKPASGFLVQVGTTGTLTFSNGKIVAPSAPARISNESTAIPEQEAYIRLSNDAGYDQMGLIIGDDYTAEYEMNADLSKMLGETNALKTWLRYTNMDMAYVAINEQLAREWIPVTVNIPAEGEYTYTLLNSSTVDELEGVYLIDYQTGVTTNLIFDDYVFTAEAGTFDNRFAINAIVGKRDTPTGADITCGDEDGVKAIKFVYHDKVFILHRGVIYDSTGKRVNVINK